jgi:hypothetical protein
MELTDAILNISLQCIVPLALSNMEQTIPKPFVFVLMPFEEEFDDVYELRIKAACKDAGGYCERVQPLGQDRSGG